MTLNNTHVNVKRMPTVTSTIWQHITRSLQLLGITTSLMWASGCNDANTGDVLTSNNELPKSQNAANTAASGHGKYCQSQSQSRPFTYALCAVSQADLSAPDSPLALKLFWKGAPTVTASSNNADTQTTANSENKDNDDILYTFGALQDKLTDSHNLIFAANAGMYNREFAPIGYTVLQGVEVLSLNLNEGAGNFHLMPNGVLWWNQAGEVHITESHTLAKELADGSAKPWYATQSGPMLVIDGKIHPQFNADSTSKKFRNGVGVCTDGHVKFVNSEEPVNFYEFAQLFKNDLSCPNALFLDGGIASALYAPAIGIHDKKNMGVMVGLVETKSTS